MRTILLSSRPGSFYSRMRSLGIPHDILVPFLKDIEKWTKNSGEEWTVGRLKSIKNEIIRQRAGLPFSPVWISHTKDSFLGSVGALQRWMRNSSHAFEKGLQLLQAYSLFYSGDPTDLQEQKFLSAVLSEPVDYDVEQVTDVISKGLRLSGLGRLNGRLPDPSDILEYMPSSEKKAPLPDGSSLPEEMALLDSLDFLRCTRGNALHYRRFHHLYDKVVGGNSNYFALRKGTSFVTNSSSDFIVGRIGLIQESGYKLRAVANPGRVFQQVLGPLGNYLYGLLKRLPWDCTFDQTLAWAPVQKALQDSQMVTCFDLSNATDLFPFTIQLKILETLLPDNKDHIDLFKEISRGSWYYRNRGTITWKSGQPLGLYPSFACFALSHGIILLGLLNKPYSGEFYILGDDVVILDQRLAEDYYTFMNNIGCKISAQKSIQSSLLAEFAGRIITSNKVIVQMKHRNLSDDSFIDLARQLGPNSLWLFKPNQRKVLKQLATVPDFLNGLGFNPDGIPLADRIRKWIHLLDKQPKPLLMDYTTYRIRNLYMSSKFNKWIDRQENKFVTLKGLALDQRAADLTSKLGMHLVPLSHLLGKNIDVVFNDSSLKISPISASHGNRPTALTSWMKRLGLS